MLRVVCCENEHTHTVHVGGPPSITYKTFDVDLPEIEAWLDKYKDQKQHSYNVRTIVGVERINSDLANDV